MRGFSRASPTVHGLACLPFLLISQERLATSTFPASFWNMPRPGSDPGMYNSSQILAYTPSKNYTAYQLHDFITVRVGSVVWS